MSDMDCFEYAQVTQVPRPRKHPEPLPNVIPLSSRTIKLSRAKFFQVFRQKIKRAVIFYLLANPAESAYLSIRDRELSNNVRLMQLRRRKVAVHIFLGWSQAGLIRQRSCRNYRKP